MTVYPRTERDTAKTRSLIPKAKGLDPAIYGGYSNNATAYMTIVKIYSNKDITYKVVGVPMRALADLKSARRQGNYCEKLKQVVAPDIMLDAKGKPKRGVKGFDIIADRILYKQVVLDGERKFMLNSAKYMSNAKQLTLSWETMRIVTGHINKEEDRDQLLINAYDEILAKVDQYLPLFDMNKFRKGLHDGRDKFVSFKPAKKREIINLILNGLHDNMVVGNLKELGIKTPFGLMQMGSGITLTPDAVLLFQSPTGLFEKRIKISKL